MNPQTTCLCWIQTEIEAQEKQASMTAQIRLATIDDATAIHAIYAPYVTETVISFELAPPTVDEMAARIQKTAGRFPWLVYQTADQQIAGYVYATPHRERAAYQWSVDVSVYISPLVGN